MLAMWTQKSDEASLTGYLKLWMSNFKTSRVSLWKSLGSRSTRNNFITKLGDGKWLSNMALCNFILKIKLQGCKQVMLNMHATVEPVKSKPVYWKEPKKQKKLHDSALPVS